MQREDEPTLDAASLWHSPPRHTSSIEEGIKSGGKLFQVVTGYLWIQMMFQVIGQLEEQRRDHATAQSMRLCKRCVTEVPVR